MAGKQVEGNQDQRRAAARDARRDGVAPSALKETTGASKQPGHKPHHAPHEEKVDSIHEGKESWRETVPDPEPADDAPPVDFSGRNGSNYTEDHARVFTALTLAQEEHNGEGVYLDEIADGAGLSESDTRALLHDLTTVQNLVSELDGSDTPDLGPRYEVRPSL
jgi:hypothetical protein